MGVGLQKKRHQNLDNRCKSLTPIVLAYPILFVFLVSTWISKESEVDGGNFFNRQQKFHADTGTSPLDDTKQLRRPVNSKQAISPPHAVKPNVSVSLAKETSGLVSICDSSPCEGFFQYSGPNRNENASLIFNSARENYNYIIEKGSHLIFMPVHNSSTPEQCVREWKESQQNFTSYGMSRSGEDTKVFETFFNSPQFWNSNQKYMEIGAHDGVRESNTRLFDVCLGWEGILVEPHPSNFAKMEKLRPTAHHLGVAPSCPSGEVVMFQVDEHTSARVGGERSTLEVHCGPLSHYLEALQIDHIDFWSLDVEGSEFDIIKTVNFDRVQIDVIISESYNGFEFTKESAAEVRPFLQQKGYLVLPSVNVPFSDVFLHKRVCHRYKFPECNSVIN